MMKPAVSCAPTLAFTSLIFVVALLATHTLCTLALAHFSPTSAGVKLESCAASSGLKRSTPTEPSESRFVHSCTGFAVVSADCGGRSPKSFIACTPSPSPAENAVILNFRDIICHEPVLVNLPFTFTANFDYKSWPLFSAPEIAIAFSVIFSPPKPNSIQ